MKMKQLTFLLLSVFSTASFAGNYADKGTEANPQNNIDDGSHFYIDVGANGYYFNPPSMNLPYSVGSYNGLTSDPIPTTSGSDYDANNWAFNPNLTLGYQFLTENEDLQKIFGQQNAIELHIAYFHNTGTDNQDYDAEPVNQFYITGNPDPFSTSNAYLTNATTDFDNTYEDVGVYYTGTKILNNTLINSPYVGIDFNYLKQDSNYTTLVYSNSDPLEGPLYSDGSDDLSSYYMGLAFGDTLTKLFATHYGVYGKAGAGLYWSHTKLEATQTPVTNHTMVLTPALNETYTVDVTDDQFTFKLNAEVGLNYYFKNNQDQMSPRITLLVGLDYWNDVPYAQNPTGPNQTVQIAYGSSFNPYAGLQFHMPF